MGEAYYFWLSAFFIFRLFLLSVHRVHFRPYGGGGGGGGMGRQRWTHIRQQQKCQEMLTDYFSLDKMLL